MRLFLFIHFAILAVVDSTSTVYLRAGEVCGDAYDLCSPWGVTSSALPPVGPELDSLYSDLIQVVNLKVKEKTDAVQKLTEVTLAPNSTAFCCARTSDCLLLPTYGTPFCWDRFTTDFFFPDGSYGSVVTGNFTSAAGTKVDLIYGDWENLDGMKGNIYSTDPTMMPHTSTMPMPTLWTSSGIGSAIPASQLGSSTTVTGVTTITPTATISAITLSFTTISIGTSACTHCNITIVPGLTGLPPPTFANSSDLTITTTMGTGTGGTGFPSASNSIFTVSSIIIPPITNNSAISMNSMSFRSIVILAMNLVVWIAI